MLNKNDPLVGAIQDIMKKNQTERDAVKAVNEKFGVQDRKVLPREKQGEWDAAYQEILTEGFKGKQGNLDANKNGRVDGDDFPLLKKGVRPVAEGNVDTVGKGENEGGSAVTYTNAKKSMGDLRKGDAETGMGRSENLAHQGNSVVTKTGKNSSSVTPSTMKEAVMNKIMKKLEEKAANAYAIGTSQAMKSTGDKPPLEKSTIKKAHKIAKAIQNEGFNNRHDSSVTASAEKQVVAVLNEEEDGYNYDPAKENQKKFAKLSGASSGKTVKNFISTRNKMNSLPKAKWNVKPEKGNYTVNKLKDQAKTAALAATGNITDTLGITDPEKSAALAKFNPRADEIGRLAGAASTIGTGPSRAALKGTEVAASTSKLAKTTAATTNSATDILSNVKPTRTTAATTNSATDILSNVKPTRTTAATTNSATTAQTTTAAGNAAAAALARNKSRISAVRRPAGAKPVQPAAKPQAASTSGVPAVARTPGNKIGIGLPKAERAGPWNRVGPNAPAAGNAARMAARQRLSATARDIRAGAGKVVSAVRNNPKLAAGAAGGAALGGFAATQLGNKPPETQAGKPSTAADSPKVSQTTTNPVEPKTFKDAFAAARKAAAEKGSTSTGKFKFKGKEYQTNTKGEKYVRASKQTDVTPKPTTTTSVTGGQGISGIASSSANKPVTKPSSQSGTTVGGSGNSVPPSADSKWQKGPDTRFNARYNYGGSKPTDQRDIRSPSNPEKVANPTFVPQRVTNRQSAELGQEISSALASRVDAKAQGFAPAGIASRPAAGIGPQQAPKPAAPTPNAMNNLGRVSQKPITGGAGR